SRQAPERDSPPLRVSPRAGLTRWFPPGSLTASRRSLQSTRSISRPSSASPVSALCALDSFRSLLPPIAGTLFRATPVLCQAGVAELRIRAVLQQNVGPCLVVQNAAETIAETRRGEPGCHACFADDVHVGALLDQQLEQPVPAAIAGTEQRILIERGDGLRVDTRVEQKCDRLERPILVVDNFADSSIETRRGEQRVGVGLRDEMRIRSRGQQDAHHLHIGSICGDNKRRRANGVVVSARPRTAESGWTRGRLKIWVRAVRQ